MVSISFSIEIYCCSVFWSYSSFSVCLNVESSLLVLCPSAQGENYPLREFWLSCKRIRYNKFDFPFFPFFFPPSFFSNRPCNSDPMMDCCHFPVSSSDAVRTKRTIASHRCPWIRDERFIRFYFRLSLPTRNICLILLFFSSESLMSNSRPTCSRQQSVV